jgi:ABC-type sulfate transport system permease subunit
MPSAWIIGGVVLLVIVISFPWVGRKAVELMVTYGQSDEPKE